MKHSPTFRRIEGLVTKLNQKHKIKDMSEFIDGIAKRLDEGANEYGDKSYSKDNVELLEEVRQELYDIPGWLTIFQVKIENDNFLTSREKVRRIKKIADICIDCANINNKLKDLL